MKRLAILGSTGSIGRNTLDIVRMFPDRFSAAALTANTNVDLLAEQIAEFKPDTAVVSDEFHAEKLKRRLPPEQSCEIRYGSQGYESAAASPKADMVVTAVVGSSGLRPTLAAISSGKDIALANKETLVMAGKLVMEMAAEKNVRIMPVDSEHSAIFQCLAGNRREDLGKIIITASGGPFFRKPDIDFKTVRVEDALNHPNWSMGKKITIDSATLMNKGLEVIEASMLFGLSAGQIDVLIHPQSIVHSMTAYRDGSVMAQLGVPDMKGAIALALSWPERLSIGQPAPDFIQLSALDFFPPDMVRFPCLKLAFDALKEGGTLPAALNAANEIAVAAFLDKRLAFSGIPDVIRNVMEHHTVRRNPGFSDIFDADAEASEYARKIIADGAW